jgi:dimethylhistidine N-methyltransferase
MTANASFTQALLEGLSSSPKRLSPKWLYDAEGSRLFEAITELPEYYPTRQETLLLRRATPEWIGRAGPGAALIEFGSGASEKTRIVLDAAPDLAAYMPVDISPEALTQAAARIAADYPHLAVRPLVGDFQKLERLPRPRSDGRRIGFFPGSTIGNLDPPEAQAFLTLARGLLGSGSLFLLGVDLVKEASTLIAAYDDAAGVTAAFNRNLLVRANREAGADFDVSGFRHRAIWKAGEAQIEMHLEAMRDMVVTVQGARFGFARGETLHTETCRKFTPEGVADLAHAAGWRLIDFWTSPEPAVALALLESPV